MIFKILKIIRFLQVPTAVLTNFLCMCRFFLDRIRKDKTKVDGNDYLVFFSKYIYIIYPANINLRPNPKFLSKFTLSL